ncbi:MAG TPA: hypothetical protein VMV81_02490 [Phycisphaerae bacterium]|nr:hypothetical protein [Phycisphaerae bacterium]
MSLIPSGVVGSVLQSGEAQRVAARPADAAKDTQAEAARRLNAGPDTLLDIEATDTDTAVHTDSGGLGSQGRQDSPPEEETAAEDSQDQPPSADDPTHIDLSA